MERYRDIIPNYDEFLRIIDEPMPTTARVNLLKTTPKELIDRLKAKGFEVERSSWCPYLLTLRGDIPAGSTIEHWLGLYYIQEATSLIAPLALSPEPKDAVLDLCAAPGGKTTHVSMLMDGIGTIVANDQNAKRLRALMSNLYKLGITNCIVTEYDGMRFPLSELKFDFALVDVPCSAEGNLRKSPQRRFQTNVRYSRRISGIQKALLLRAIDSVKVGGVIVYSTCTFAPEENEMVVQHALTTRDVQIEPLELNAPHSPGLTEWDGLSFHSDMQYAVRIYPHHFNSGGGFVARLRKLSDVKHEAEGYSALFSHARKGLQLAKPRITDSLLDYFNERFGIPPQIFNGLNFIESADSVWMTSADLGYLGMLGRVSSVGMRLAHIIDGRFKPTSYALAWLQPHIKSSTVNITLNELVTLLLGQPIKLHADVSRGYVAIAFEGDILGCGFYTGDELRCEMPKGRRAELLDVLYCEHRLKEKPHTES
ncbi:MAG: NOL1/NOP2/sun family putative RNA methylase [Armatimonadota bacterium]|nr:NOL1/NOP2/sun family putative RNA methylase [Armatimonadota bacterium]MDW8026429.1 NOL1/NOP2/sun family putative RNA methylase [Armatimonadota bacterium]